MILKSILKTSLASASALLMLCTMPAKAEIQENSTKINADQVIEEATPEPLKTQKYETTPDGWIKLAENHMEVVYMKAPPKNVPANSVGIEVKVIAQEKDLFDYAQGVAMADCSNRSVFPVSGEIYDTKGYTIDPMHIPLMKGMEYVNAFPQTAYDELADRLCEGEAIPEAY